MKILVLTRSYPARSDLYKYPFVHRRVVAYLAAGHDVRVFRPDAAGEDRYEFDGVTCTTGGPAAFRQLAAEWRPDVIAVHGLSEQLWEPLEPVIGDIPVRAWLHGSEIPAFMRQKALCVREAERADAFDQLQRRCAFWDSFLAAFPPRLKLVFVSAASVDLAREDWGHRFDEGQYSIIPNPVDTSLFRFSPKAPEDRFKVLLIRPFDSLTYANDLAVDAIVRLASRPGADRLRFTIFGDGPLFEQTLEPLRGMGNVAIARRFLRQEEIAEEHSRHGIFLVPTRLDTQGVSRDEAMASGLVPVTNAVPAVREFVDPGCAALVAPEDSEGLADALWEMVENPDLFLRRSSAAAARIGRERSSETIIPRELALLEEAANG